MEALGKFIARNLPTNFGELATEGKATVINMLAELYEESMRRDRLVERLWDCFLATDFSERNLHRDEEVEWAAFSFEEIESFLDSYGPK